MTIANFALPNLCRVIFKIPFKKDIRHPMVTNKITDVQRADSAARRKAIIIVIISAIVGSVLIVAFESKRSHLFDWLLSDQEKSVHRLKIFIFFGCCLCFDASFCYFGFPMVLRI
jgi:hypothetical protein